MNRRQFCRTSVAAGVAAAYPWLSGCTQEAEVSTPVVSSIPAVSLDGAEIELEKAALKELSEALSGPMLLNGDDGYDDARKIWNGMHDKRPAVIARCKNTQDVCHAVDFARGNNLLLAVRGGGHSWPGKSVCEGGMMLDLALMNDVDVDADAKRAHAQGGALLNTLDTASLEHGLVTTAGVVSHTGVGGYTLGGGFGRLNRKYGLTIDNLRSAEIVTADGTVRTISEEQDPDLFWAIRGGGGNFGVVTKFEYELHPFERNIYSGMLLFPIAAARDVLEFYGGWYQTLSNEMYVGPVMVTLPDEESTGVVGFEIVYNGDPAQGEKELAPLRSVATPMLDDVKMQDYMVMQTQEDVSFGHGVRSYAKNGMVKEVTQALVDAMIDAYRQDPRTAFFTHTSGGVVKDVGELDTAFTHRNAETMIIVAGGWTDPADDEWAIGALREWFYALEPHTGGYYDNIDFDADKVAGAYGPAYERLSQVKGQYDVGNLFRLNNNISPA